jgi:hypothetical protein
MSGITGEGLTIAFGAAAVGLGAAAMSWAIAPDAKQNTNRNGNIKIPNTDKKKSFGTGYFFLRKFKNFIFLSEENMDFASFP